MNVHVSSTVPGSRQSVQFASDDATFQDTLSIESYLMELAMLVGTLVRLCDNECGTTPLQVKIL